MPQPGATTLVYSLLWLGIEVLSLRCSQSGPGNEVFRSVLRLVVVLWGTTALVSSRDRGSIHHDHLQ